jgi:hypothetical protein
MIMRRAKRAKIPLPLGITTNQISFSHSQDPDPTCTLGVRRDMEYRRGFLGSFCRDAGELDHLGPFRCVFSDQPSEIGGRAQKYRCTQSDAVPGTLIEARDEITYDRDVG